MSELHQAVAVMDFGKNQARIMMALERARNEAGDHFSEAVSAFLGLRELLKNGKKKPGTDCPQAIKICEFLQYGLDANQARMKFFEHVESCDCDFCRANFDLASHTYWGHLRARGEGHEKAAEVMYYFLLEPQGQRLLEVIENYQ